MHIYIQTIHVSVSDPAIMPTRWFSDVNLHFHGDPDTIVLGLHNATGRRSVYRFDVIGIDRVPEQYLYSQTIFRLVTYMINI